MMASTMLDQILDDIKAAMKAQQKDKVAALRLLHSEIKNVAINERREPTDDDTLTVIGRLHQTAPRSNRAIHQRRSG